MPPKTHSWPKPKFLASARRVRPEILLMFAASLCAAKIGQSSANPLSLHDAVEPIPSRLPRTNLLVYATRSGKLAPVKTVSDWKKRRAEIIHGMETVMGPLPDSSRRCPLDVRVEQEIDCGEYIRRLISYQSEPGSRVPAYLLLPKRALASRERFPGVLALHPTDMEYGQRVVVEPLRAHYSAYAVEIVRRGFVVLAPAYPLMANYNPPLKQLGYQSGSMKAVWDNARGLDFLETLPCVKKGSFGAVGHSLGGHNALFTAVFEPRIKVVVSSCGFDSFEDYMGGNIKGWTSERYMPKLLNYQGQWERLPFDFYEVLGALAPRALFINAPLGDTNFKASSVDKVVSAASRVYRLYKASPMLEVEHPDCGHEFPEAVRERAYEFLAEHLR